MLQTAMGDKKHLLAGRRAGADYHLTKPVDQDDLRARLIAAGNYSVRCAHWPAGA